MSEYGSGLALDDNWDLTVDPSSGDTARVDGVTELKKDLAFSLGRAFNDQAVGYADAGQEADIRLLATRVVEADPRVASVSNINVDNSPRNDTLTIGIGVQAVDGEDFTMEVDL